MGLTTGAMPAEPRLPSHYCCGRGTESLFFPFIYVCFQLINAVAFNRYIV